ncbi:MAG TPA: ABC transporter ATP-binding protein [Microvirga sp.]|nr:ABC transporter ATP-binding protein [Microvirga sp.]
MNRLVIEGLRAGYGAVQVLHGIDFEIRQGELVGVLGMNGNGKSTLLNAIMGLVRPSAGRVFLEWDGESVELAGEPPHRIVERGLAFVPEGRRLVPNLTVEENLRLAGGSRRARARLKDNLEFCYDRFPVLRERRRQFASTMSGGQQQMLAIARALMTSPRVMIVDEPSVGLAPIVVEQVIATLRDLQQANGLTILMAEQSFFQAVDVASRAYVLSHGRIIRTFQGGADESTHDEIRRAMMGVA